jgi:hypothetical protein
VKELGQIQLAACFCTTCKLSMAVSFSNHWWGKEKNQKNIL